MTSNLGSKKKDSVYRMDRFAEDLPKLSNEMQLSIMNKVKNGELSIEDALNLARRDRRQLLKQQCPSEEEQQSSQYNFSVLKHGRYRWQKRVFQIDLKTKMLCSIEKGIIKRQLPFSIVKSCDDGVGSKFTISFKGHHDYELEARSLEDKHKMMQLVNQIIYGNIYCDNEEGDADTRQQPQASQSLREGILLLHRGGLASFRWVKYEVQLHPGQLTLVPFRSRGPADGELTSAVPMSTVIHLSDGDTSVQKPHSPDAFTLVTHKNQYQFKVPVSDHTTTQRAIQQERDAWLSAIDKLCSDWKRKSRGEQAFVETTFLRSISISEDIEDSNSDQESSGGSTSVNTIPIYPPVDYANADPTSSSGGQLLGDNTKPPPEPSPRAQSPSSPCAAPLLPVASPDPSPSHTPITSSTTVPEPPKNKSGSSPVKVPAPPYIPAPPPLLLKTTISSKTRTRAFHWDPVTTNNKLFAKSFWMQERARNIELNTSRLYEQFAVKDPGTFVVSEQSNTQHIMLNEKIAHNFNIFLKSFSVQPGELKDKLFIVHKKDGGLSDEHITSLRRYVPTLDDVEMYKSHKGPVADLHIVDQYMMEMCNIPYLSTQLDLLLVLRELPNSMNDMQPLINQKIRMCMQLYNCRSFVSVLEYLLAMGNYLNENAGKGKAKGFRLSSLAKVSQLRGRDRKFTLLHALVEQIMLHEPCVATFTQELAEFETVPGASIKGLTAEVDVLKNELQKVIQYRKTFKKRHGGTHHLNFSKDLKILIDKHNTDLAALTKSCEEMKKLYSLILVKFGEPADQDSQELFGLICQFIYDFKRTYAEVV
ncbi:protein diaphanous homolog 1 isoform X1 [Solea solea]|uniref:protein diaphanous homolog 1 isoform X1 n=1 Tax=Solea solea TaxID=90069 RepID=UPI00272BCE31|nr:protein diaphanous homolog 1 isoform X1 [Solea solea]